MIDSAPAIVLTPDEAFSIRCAREFDYEWVIAQARLSAPIRFFLQTCDIRTSVGWAQFRAAVGPAACALIDLQVPYLGRASAPAQTRPSFPAPRLVAPDEVPPAAPASRLLSLEEIELLPIPAYSQARYAVYARGFNMLYGRPGAGKSLIAVDLVGLMVSEGKRVIYAALEGREGLAARFRAWEQHHKKPLRDLRLWVDDLRLLDRENYQRFLTIAAQYRAEFVVIDTLARSMVGVNENDTTAAGLYVQAVDNLRRDLGAGVLLVHHQSKLGSLRGSTVLEGAADSILRADANESSGGIVVHNTLDKGGKNKDRDESPPVYLAKLPVQIALRGQTVDSVVLEEDERVIKDGSTGTLKGRMRDVVEILAGAGKALTTDDLVDAGIKQATVYRAINDLKGAGLIEGNGAHGIRLTQKGVDAL